jgi:hypothetical protein
MVHPIAEKKVEHPARELPIVPACALVLRLIIVVLWIGG